MPGSRVETVGDIVPAARAKGGSGMGMGTVAAEERPRC